MAGIEEAEAQLSEIELLTSMFPSKDEFVIKDQLALAELREYVEGTLDSPPSSRPEFVIQHKMDTESMEGVTFAVSFMYVLDYPNVLPDISVRCAELSRAQQTQLHMDMNSFLKENCCGEVCVLSAVEWVKDNIHRYISKNPSTTAPAPITQPEEMFTRLWIYSHHIYNKSKRKNILEWAHDLGLTGFSMPGKPGVVCVEGLQTSCEEFWARVKVLTWKRILIRHREDIPLDSEVGHREETLSSFRKFSGFEETIFDPRGSRGNHMDLGQLYQFLNEKGCGDIFQLYFGIEGR
ncbi:RWD domain-containing protein 2B [Megalops cyprinoides]|uniref:RWD domain-containing protein 2B n=1 Tax=Megalops cyprinoides TaxID=118141 RepID=UPI0018644542|nr:RWD domain-containing protein 2B [Megalops cyprinoides]